MTFHSSMRNAAMERSSNTCFEGSVTSTQFLTRLGAYFDFSLVYVFCTVCWGMRLSLNGRGCEPLGCEVAAGPEARRTCMERRLRRVRCSRLETVDGMPGVKGRKCRESVPWPVEVEWEYRRANPRTSGW